MSRNMHRDQASVVERETIRRPEDYAWEKPTSGVEIPVQVSAPSAPKPVEDNQTKLQKLIDQGYSTEVARVILENEKN